MYSFPDSHGSSVLGELANIMEIERKGYTKKRKMTHSFCKTRRGEQSDILNFVGECQVAIDLDQNLTFPNILMTKSRTKYSTVVNIFTKETDYHRSGMAP
jgi:hypothetical protein